MWKRAICALVLLAPVAGAFPADGRMEMDIERDHVALTGTWQQLDEHPEEEVWRPAVADSLGPWKDFDLPGALAHWSERERNLERQCAWLRRTFELNGQQAARQAVLRWGGIRFGAAAWINGVRVGAHPTIGPAQLLVPPGTLRAGENEITIRVRGWGSLAKSDNGTPLIPVGADLHWGAKSMSAYDDVWLEFYERAYMKWLLAVPDVGDRAVTMRVWFDAARELPEQVELQARCLLPDGAEAGSASATVSPSEGPVALRVPLEEVRTWTPREPFLYRAVVTARTDEQVCDEASFRFGMRDVAVRDGHYRLNGRPLWLRGSNLVHEWTWWGEGFSQEPKRYLVDEGRNMNLNCFRTHTLPPNTRWLDVCDENGTMILAEFPTTINYHDMGFTEEQREAWHRNVLLDATGWMTKIWNHPAVVTWVLTNESAWDNEWEAGPFHQHVVGLDPTRPTLRTGETDVGTPDAVDVHTCDNYSYGPTKDAWATCRELAENKDPQRALGNSEYMNYFDSDENRRRRRLGDPQHPGAKLDYAECAAEDTEMMRRLDFDLILPYMYAGWPRFRGNDWRPDYPTPMAAALHSAMAPVLASLELLDRNFIAGSRVTTPLHLINELHQPVEARLELIITPHNPLFVPDEEALAARTWSAQRTLNLPADSHEVTEVTWRVPDEEG
ncbi:MAG: glycoside hydrolase family 2 TIM barrel-domain containing protein, partial [Candidatus Brocadiia bacterium]